MFNFNKAKKLVGKRIMFIGKYERKCLYYDAVMVEKGGYLFIRYNKPCLNFFDRLMYNSESKFEIFRQAKEKVNKHTKDSQKYSIPLGNIDSFGMYIKDFRFQNITEFDERRIYETLFFFKQKQVVEGDDSAGT